MNKLLLTLGFLSIGSTIYGQQQDTIKNLPTEQVEVVKQFEARLEDAKKVNIIPEPPAQRVLEQFGYQVNTRPILLEYPEPTIRHVPIPQAAREKTFNGYAHLGIGNLNAIDGAIAYSLLTKQETEIGLSANYLTMNNTAERFQSMQSIQAAAHVSHQLSSLAAVSADIEYHQRDVGFYGSVFDQEVSDTSIYQRRINTYSFGFGLSNIEENEFDVDYNLDFVFNNLSLQDENLIENNFLVGAGVEKHLNEKFSFFLKGKADISSITDSTTFSYNNYFVNPGLKYTTDNINFDGGLVVAFVNNTALYFGNVEIDFLVYKRKLVPFIFWDMDVQKNNLLPLLSYNPYLQTSISSKLQNTTAQRFGAGVKGSFQNLQYRAKLGFGNIDSLVLFRNVLLDNGLRQFTIESDTANIVEVNLEASYKFSDAVEAFVSFDYTDYSITVWHLPTYNFKAAVNYFLLDQKLRLSPSLFVRDGVTVLNDELEIEELPYMLDLSIHADYKILEQFSAFAEVNNILSSEYQQWFDYSNFGINAKIGVRAKF